jgi:hypothetical protein
VRQERVAGREQEVDRRAIGLARGGAKDIQQVFGPVGEGGGGLVAHRGRHRLHRVGVAKQLVDVGGGGAALEANQVLREGL